MNNIKCPKKYTKYIANILIILSRIIHDDMRLSKLFIKNLKILIIQRQMIIELIAM